MKKSILTLILITIPSVTWAFSFSPGNAEFPAFERLRSTWIDNDVERLHLIQDVITVHQFATSHHPTVTPVPASLWLLASGLIGLVAWRKKRDNRNSNL